MQKFRKVCWTLHREIGFLAVGMTLVYAISGIAVNHAHHWDANYERVAEPGRIEAPGAGPTAEVRPVVLERLGLTEDQVKSTWRASPEIFQVFLQETGGYDVNLLTGETVRRGVAKRPFFFDVNFMHLNNGKGPWTGIADVYAGMLVVLALTGPFLVRGRKGLAGRGGLLLVLGMALPVVYAVLTRARL
jgi:hypothetical protein